MTDTNAPAGGSPYPPAEPQGQLYQPYPGAPPVWAAPAAPPPRPPASGSSTLAVVALILAIAGVLSTLLPLFGLFSAVVLLTPAIIMAIIALARRTPGRGMAIGALITAGVGSIGAIVWNLASFTLIGLLGSIGNGAGSFADTDQDSGHAHDRPVLGVADDVDGTSLAYGTPVTIVDESTGEEVWTVTVGAPVDATADAAADALEDAPANGAYLAIPIELTNLTDESIDLSDQFEYTLYPSLITGDGGFADTAFLYGAPDYPAAWSLPPIAPGETAVYYEAFDVAATVIDTGVFVIDLDTQEQVSWQNLRG